MLSLKEFKFMRKLSKIFFFFSLLFCFLFGSETVNALENFQSAIRYAEQMDESGFRNILFPCRSGINICAKISEIDTAESLGVKIHETLEKFQSKLSPEEPIFKKMEKSSELWKKHFTGEWIVNAIAVLEKIKKYKAG